MMVEGDVERVGGRVRIGRRRGWGRLALALCTAAALWGGRELWLPDVGKETGTPVFQELGAEAARACLGFVWNGHYPAGRPWADGTGMVELALRTVPSYRLGKERQELERMKEGRDPAFSDYLKNQRFYASYEALGAGSGAADAAGSGTAGGNEAASDGGSAVAEPAGTADTKGQSSESSGSAASDKASGSSGASTAETSIPGTPGQENQASEPAETADTESQASEPADTEGQASEPAGSEPAATAIQPSSPGLPAAVGEGGLIISSALPEALSGNAFAALPSGQESRNSQAASARPVTGQTYSLEQLADYDFLMKTFYSVHPSTTAGRDEMNAKDLLSKDLRLTAGNDAPQILIYHSHSQETFADYGPKHREATVVGVGAYLAELLRAKGYNVIHDTSVYDLRDGKLDRSQAYTYALEGITAILQENPSIEVVLDIHRDGVAEGTHLVSEVNGKPTASIMFFNGMSQTPDGPIEYLPNPYREDNLAFSLQMQVKAAAYFPGLTRKIYLKGLRYNLHVRPRSSLVEVGAQTNTYQEAKNAMEPLAEVLDMVLQGN